MRISRIELVSFLPLLIFISLFVYRAYSGEISEELAAALFSGAVSIVILLFGRFFEHVDSSKEEIARESEQKFSLALAAAKAEIENEFRERFFLNSERNNRARTFLESLTKCHHKYDELIQLGKHLAISDLLRVLAEAIEHKTSLRVAADAYYIATDVPGLLFKKFEVFDRSLLETILWLKTPDERDAQSREILESESEKLRQNLNTAYHSIREEFGGLLAEAPEG